MKNCKTFLLASVVAVAGFSSCSQTAKIEGTLHDAPDSEVIVKLLDVNKYKVLDTLKTNQSGNYKYKLEVKAGQPEFVYLFYKDTKIASLLLQKGDKVNVSSDTLGSFSVTGSDETLKLMDVEKDEAEFNDKFLATAGRLADLTPDSDDAKALKKELSSQYVKYYRSRVKYILTNSHSLTSIPVLYQVVGNGIPVFGQNTDALHFRNICDSLKTVYPESKYVKALDLEAERRQQMLTLGSRISNAEQAGFPELELADVNGQKVKLSSVDSKVVMLYFWNSADAAQNMFNLEVMKHIYNDFHAKGLEIYAVSADTDKAAWASVVKGQKLPWINVCDGFGAESPAISLYNVASLPTVYFIVDGALTQTPKVKDEASLKAYLASVLK